MLLIRWVELKYDYTLLTVPQILFFEHLEYIISFIRGKLDKLDEFNKKQNEAGLPSSGVVALEASPCFYLGSSEGDDKQLSKLPETAGVQVPSLPNLLEAYVNKFRTREERYYRVRKDHLVADSSPAWSVGADM